MAWPQLEGVLDGYLKNLTATNICDAWLAGEKYIDPACENYIVLMTDGHDNMEGTAAEGKRMEYLRSIFAAFCSKYNNTMGIYVELTQAATLPEAIRKVFIDCQDLTVVDGSQGIPSFGCPIENYCHINTRDLPTDITLGFSNSGLFDASFIQADNQFVTISVKDGKINKGNITLHIESKLGDNIEALNRAIGVPQYEVPGEVVSESVNILNPEIIIVLHNAPLRTLDIAADESSSLSNEIKRVKPFLWVQAQPTDTLRWNLNPFFNEAATADNGRAMFKLSSNCNLKELSLVYQGETITDSIIVISPDEESVIELVVPAAKDDAEISLTMTEVISHNLDRINGAVPDHKQFNLEGKYSTSMSLPEIIFWCILGILALAALVWFGFLRTMKYPQFKKGVITIQSPYFATLRVKGYRKIVMGPSPAKQGFINSLFTGKILYHTNAVWPAEVEVTPSGRNMRFRCQSGSLLSDPTPLWSKGNSYKIINASQPSQKIEIFIN